MVGVMSGTSADGISAAAVRFTESEGHIGAELLAFVQHPYDDPLRDRLLAAVERGTPREYCRLSFDLAGMFADAALSVMKSAKLGTGDVECIASHGHTIWHEPGHSTWQIGEPAMIAERTGVECIANFRTRDVVAGGQGAPLVSVADALIFSSPHGWRALQNLGGIGNVSLVPPGGDTTALRAFDTGPGVVLIDEVTRRLVPGARYDVDGAIAMRGSADEAVVSELMSDPYFAAQPPKSTGREYFSRAYAESMIERCRARLPGTSTENIVATAVRFTAASIADAYERWVTPSPDDVVLSGGGARNPALVAAISTALAPLPVRRFDELFFDGEAKEAVAFALLGWLHRRARPGNVPAATGARGERILGIRSPA